MVNVMDEKPIVLIGATGRTGLAFLERAVLSGLKVRTIVRDPSRLKKFMTSEQVEYRQIKLNDTQALSETFVDCRAVISVIGPSGINPNRLYSETYASVTEAMENAGVSRLIALTSSGHEDDPSFPLFFRWFLKPLVLRKLYDDMVTAESIIEASKLDWTIVRPSMFVKHEPGKLYRLNDRINPVGGWKISREDTGLFLLDELENDNWLRMHPAIAY